MVVFILYVKGELEGVSKVSVNPNANICLNVKNPLSDYEIREKIVVNPDDIIEAEGKEPECHFAITWEGANKRSTLKIMTPAEIKSSFKKSGKKSGKNSNSPIPRDVTSEDNDEYVPMIAFDCRGLEPYEFFPMGDEFVVVSEGGKEFNEDVDLSEGDWADYDDENDAPVSISSFESKIERV